MSQVALKTSRRGTISLYLQTSKMYHSERKKERKKERERKKISMAHRKGMRNKFISIVKRQTETVYVQRYIIKSETECPF